MVKRLLAAIDWLPTFLPALVVIALILTWPPRVLFDFGTTTRQETSCPSPRTSPATARTP